MDDDPGYSEVCIPNITIRQAVVGMWAHVGIVLLKLDC